MLCKSMRDRYDLVVITNDIYTKEDQRLLIIAGALPAERILGVETGGCPHTAIREDASINLEAVDRMLQRYPDADVVFIESGGDNLAATFSPELSDLTIYVIDVAGGEKIPRKGGPGITKSDLLVINKVDLAPYVGASLAVMESDARKMRGERPFVMCNLREGVGLAEIVSLLRDKGCSIVLTCIGHKRRSLRGSEKVAKVLYGCAVRCLAKAGARSLTIYRANCDLSVQAGSLC